MFDLLTDTKQARRANAWKFSGQARVNGMVVAEATYSAMIMDQPAL